MRDSALLIAVLVVANLCSSTGSAAISVDLIVAGADEMTEEACGIAVALNDDYDESGGQWTPAAIVDHASADSILADDLFDHTRGPDNIVDTADDDDNELADAELVICGAPCGCARWCLRNSHPDRLRVWIHDPAANDWVPLGDSTQSILLGADGRAMIPLKLEGIAVTDQACQIRLTAVMQYGHCCLSDCVPISVVDVEMFVNLRADDGTNDLDDDYLTWSPTQCEMRIVGLAGSSHDFVAHVVNDPAVDRIVPASPPLAIPKQMVNNPDRYAGGRVRFALEPETGWPANKTAADRNLTLALPASGDFVRFRLAGEFGRPSFNDKDVVLRVHQNDVNGRVFGNHRAMVRVRKNANRMHDFEIKRLLDAWRAYKDVVGGRSYDEQAEIHRQSFNGGNEAHGGTSQPSFAPWHRAYLLQCERDLQTINDGQFRAVTLPYWNWDEATPRIWTDWFMGAPAAENGTAAADVVFDINNPLDGWVTPTNGGAIQRRRDNFAGHDVTQRPERMPGLFAVPLRPDPLVASDSVLTRISFGAGGSGSIMDNYLEGLIHNWSHGWNCVGGQISGGNSADDPAFYFLHCQIDREWAAWQNYRNRFGSAADDYDLSDGDVFVAGTSMRQLGSHLNDPIWPWDLSGGPNPDFLQSRPQALGGEFGASSIRNLWPATDAQPTNRSMIDYEGRAVPELGLGFCYDDIAFGRGSAGEGALFRVTVVSPQTAGTAFTVRVEAIDSNGAVRPAFTGKVWLRHDDGTFGISTPTNQGVHINGTASTNDDYHNFVASDLGVHEFSVTAYTPETIARFWAFADRGGLTGESGSVTIDP